jgi:hypothetical protein
MSGLGRSEFCWAHEGTLMTAMPSNTNTALNIERSGGLREF